ncbi:hypothetical protein PENTCL1PPCAC_16955, partial [Pristionchus entomophagus]
DMQRPVLLYGILPFVIISLLLYARIIFIAWLRSSMLLFNTFFFRLTRSQAIIDISYVVIYFMTELPQEWQTLWHLLTDLNGTIIPQLIYCHTYFCIIGQA